MVSLILMVIIIFSFSFFIYAESDNADVTTNESESSSAIERKPLMELKEERTLYSKKILNNDGTITAEFSSLPMFYKNERGELAEIDTSLEEITKPLTAKGTAGQEYDFAVTRNSFKTFFSRENKGEVKYEVGDTWVKMKPLDINRLKPKNKTELEVKDNSLMYSGIWPGVDLEYVIMPGMLKENIIINSPDTRTSFQFELFSPELSAVEGTEGELNLVDNNDYKVLTFPTPFLMDSSPEPVVGSAYYNILSREGNKTVIEVSVDEVWLSQNELTYPLVLDPTAYLSNSGSSETKYFTINFKHRFYWECSVYGHHSVLTSDRGYFKIYEPVPDIFPSFDFPIFQEPVVYKYREYEYDSKEYSGSYYADKTGEWRIVVGGTNQYSGGSGRVTYEFDSTGPQGYIAINNDSEGTNNSSVSLALSASDSQSGVNKMRFSNNNSSYSDWESYSTSKSWNITDGDGTKTVYVQYIDKAGNTSKYSDQIILDTTPPVKDYINIGEKSTNSITVDWSFHDQLIGMSNERPYQYALTTTNNEPTVGINDFNSKSKIFSDLTSKQSYYTWIRAFDRLDNITEWYQSEVFSPFPEIIPSFSVSPYADVNPSTGQPIYQVNLTAPEVECSKYMIERNQPDSNGEYDPDNWSEIASLTYDEMLSNNFTYTDNNLTAHGKYRYRVYTENAVGDKSTYTSSDGYKISNIKAQLDLSPEDELLTNENQFTFNIPDTDLEGDTLKFRVIYKLEEEEEQYSSTITQTGPVTVTFDSDGNWFWWLEVEESSGVFSETYSTSKRTLRIDTTAPEGELRVINDAGEEYTVEEPTRNPQVRLDISGLTDNGGVIDSGIKETLLWNGVNRPDEFLILNDLTDSEGNIYPEKAEMIADSRAGISLTENSQYNLPWILANGSDGERSVTLEIGDNAGNAASITRTCLLDRTPPAPPVIDDFNHSHSVKKDNKIITFNWLNQVEDVSYFKGIYEINGDIYNINPLDITITKDNETVTEGSYEINVDTLGYNQPVTIKITSVDKAGNESTTQTSYTAYTLARLGAIVDISGGYDQVNGWQHYIQLTLAEPEPAGSVFSHLLEYGRLENDGFIAEGTIEILDQTSNFIHSNLQPHQEKDYRLVALNSSGDRIYGSAFTGRVPNTAPGAPVIGANDYPLGWKISFQDGIDQVEFKYEPAVDVDFDSLKHIIYWAEGDYTASEPETGWKMISQGDIISTPLEINTDDHGKIYTWYVKAEEVNYELESISNRATFKVDLNTPTIIIEEITPYTNQENLTVTATDVMDETDPAEVYSDIDRILYSRIDPDSNPTPEIEVPSLTPDENCWLGEIPLEEGEYIIQVTAYDKAGNSSLQKNRELKVDYTAPQITAFNLDLPRDAGIYQTFTEKIDLEITMEDPLSSNYASGLKKLNYWFIENRGDETVQEPEVKPIAYGTQPPYQFEMDISALSENRQYYLAIQAEDQAGNTSTIKYLDPVYIDRTAPVLSLDISGYKKYGSRNYLANLANLIINSSAVDNESEISAEGFNIYLVNSGEYLNTGWNDWDTLKKTVLTDGQEYQLAFQAVNGVGNRSTIMGEPFIYDSSGPANLELTVPAGKFISGETIIFKAEAVDNHSPVTSYQLAIGSEPDGRDLTAGIAGNIDGYLELEFINNEYRLTLPETVGGIYHTTLIVTNAAGKTTNLSGDTIEIDNSQEKLAVIDEGPYTASDNQLSARWLYSGEREITSYRYRIKEKGGSYLTEEKSTTGTDITVTDLNLETGLTYQFEIVAEYSDGTVSGAVLSPGVKIDITAPLINTFNPPEFSTSEKITFDWAGHDPDSNILKVEVALGTDYNQTDVTAGWVELVDSTLNSDSSGQPLNLTTGQHYYPMLRITNGAGVQTDLSGSSIIIDDTPPPAPIVVLNGEYINPDQPLIIDWTMTELQGQLDLESGNTNYYWAYSTDKSALTLTNQSLNWHEAGNVLKNRFNNISEIVDGEIADGTGYYFAVKTTNGAGLTSIGLSDGLVIDSSAPSIPELKVLSTINLDGQLVNREVYYINSTENLKLWIAAADTESDVNKYMYGYDLQEQSAEADRISYLIEDVNEYNQPQVIDIENPDLIEGEIYNFAGESYNGAELISQTGYSSGLLLDTTTPRVINVNGTAAGDYLIFDWDLEEDSTISSVVRYETALVTSPTEISDQWEDNGISRILTKDVSGLPDGQYYLKVRAYNAAGNYSRSGQEYDEVGISPVVILDRTAPEVAELNHKDYTHDILDEVFIKAKDNEQGSGIKYYQYALGNYVNPTIYSGNWIEVINNADHAVIEDQIEVSLNTIDIPHGEEIYLWARVKDNVNLWSDTRKSSRIIVDHTPPELEQISIRGPEAVNTTDKITGLALNYQNADLESGITHYRIGVAKEKNGEWETYPDSRPVEEYDGRVTGLDMIEGDYYLAVELFNAVGLSAVKYSEEQVAVDTTPPELTFLDTNSELVFNNPDTEKPGDVKYTLSEIASVTFTLTYPDGLFKEYQTEEELAAELEHIFDFTESGYGIYTLTAVVVDKAGNSMEQEVSKTIRVNAPPDIMLPVEINTTPGRPTTLRAYLVQDPDGGYLTDFSWDTGVEGDVITEPAPEYKYYELGDYQATLTVTDNDGGISSASTTVKVRNTSQGRLYVDETWEGIHRIYADILVPQGIKLTVLQGTEIIVDGIPGETGYYHLIDIEGELDIKGVEENRVQIYSVNNQLDSWQGIRISGRAEITGTEIKQAFRALTVLETGQADISGTIFRENKVGIHAYGSSPNITDCIFRDNQLYGIKEDNGGGRPVVVDSVFSNNGIDYYHQQLNKITMDMLNGIEGNSGNIGQ